MERHVVSAKTGRARDAIMSAEQETAFLATEESATKRQARLRADDLAAKEIAARDVFIIEQMQVRANQSDAPQALKDWLAAAK